MIASFIRITFWIIFTLMILIFLSIGCYFIILKYHYKPINGISSTKPFHNTLFSSTFKFENYEKVKVGARINEVEKLLGKPYKYYRNKIYTADIDTFYFASKYSNEKNNLFYNFKWCMITVYYNKDSILINKSLTWWDD